MMPKNVVITNLLLLTGVVIEIKNLNLIKKYSTLS